MTDRENIELSKTEVLLKDVEKDLEGKSEGFELSPHFTRNGRITVNVANFDYLIGKLFTHTELLGLPERQLSAFKSTTRDMFWEWYNAFMENETGLSDPSHQWRVEAGIEKQ